jgi:hypothetical protein
MPALTNPNPAKRILVIGFRKLLATKRNLPPAKRKLAPAKSILAPAESESATAHKKHTLASRTGQPHKAKLARESFLFPPQTKFLPTSLFNFFSPTRTPAQTARQLSPSTRQDNPSNDRNTEPQLPTAVWRNAGCSR